jgi:hypothetical protein
MIGFDRQRERIAKQRVVVHHQEGFFHCFQSPGRASALLASGFLSYRPLREPEACVKKDARFDVMISVNGPARGRHTADRDAMPLTARAKVIKFGVCSIGCMIG